MKKIVERKQDQMLQNIFITFEECGLILSLESRKRKRGGAEKIFVYRKMTC